MAGITGRATVAVAVAVAVATQTSSGCRNHPSARNSKRLAFMALEADGDCVSLEAYLNSVGSSTESIRYMTPLPASTAPTIVAELPPAVTVSPVTSRLSPTRAVGKGRRHRPAQVPRAYLTGRSHVCRCDT